MIINIRKTAYAKSDGIREKFHFRKVTALANMISIVIL